MKTPRYLLDTDICIYISKHRPAEVLHRFRKLRPGEVAMSVITHGELSYGAWKSSRSAEALAALAELSTLIPVLAVGPSVGEQYGQIRSQLESSGRLIGNNDLWIAAHARALGIVLVTNNEKEFSRVPGLVVENWVKPERQSGVHESQERCRIRRARRRP
jgi:tRNA(fMet)-specific endonuclease VapC